MFSMIKRYVLSWLLVYFDTITPNAIISRFVIVMGQLFSFCMERMEWTYSRPDTSVLSNIPSLLATIRFVISRHVKGVYKCVEKLIEPFPLQVMLSRLDPSAAEDKLHYGRALKCQHKVWTMKS